MTLRTAAPWLVRAWKVWANVAGMAVIALAFGAGLVQAVSGRDAVVTVSNVRKGDGSTLDPSEVMRTRVGERYRYLYDMERHEACPGEVVIIFTSANTPTPAVITLRKPSVLTEPKSYSDVKIDNPLPDPVTPGLWDVDTSLVSHCANREWTDPIAKFRLEVAAR